MLHFFAMDWTLRWRPECNTSLSFVSLTSVMEVDCRPIHTSLNWLVAVTESFMSPSNSYLWVDFIYEDFPSHGEVFGDLSRSRFRLSSAERKSWWLSTAPAERCTNPTVAWRQPNSGTFGSWDPCYILYPALSSTPSELVGFFFSIFLDWTMYCHQIPST